MLRVIATQYAVPTLVVLAAACGCKSGNGSEPGSDQETESAKKSEAVTTAVSVPAGASAKSAKPPGQGRTSAAPAYNIPVGPGFAVEPGMGIGPIRFGATVETIERLMEAKCTVKSQSLCRYSIQAADFHLADGVLVKIHLQGDERVFDPGKPEHTYGIFNGELPGGVQLGMYEHYVREVLGEPESELEFDPDAQLKQTGFPTVKRAKYWGMTLEYDKLANGNVVLAGVVIEKGDPAKKPKSQAPRRPRPKPPLH